MGPGDSNPLSLIDTCHSSHSHQPFPLSPQREELPKRAKYFAPAGSPGLFAHPFILLEAVAAPPAKALPRGNNGGLKPTMQMASFVLPGVTQASDWGWEHRSSPSPAHPHPDLCPGPFVQVPKRGEKEGGGRESEESKGIRKLEEWGGEERQRERTRRKRQRKGESESEKMKEKLLLAGCPEQRLLP